MKLPVDPNSGREITRADMMAGLGVGKSQLQNYAKAFEEEVGWEIPRRGSSRIYREWHLDVFLAVKALAPMTLPEATALILREGREDSSLGPGHKPIIQQDPVQPSEQSPLSVEHYLRLRGEIAFLKEGVRASAEAFLGLSEEIEELRKDLKRETASRMQAVQAVRAASWSMRITRAWQRRLAWLSHLTRRR